MKAEMKTPEEMKQAIVNSITNRVDPEYGCIYESESDFNDIADEVMVMFDQQSASLRQEVERLRGEKAEVIKGFIEWYNSLHSSNYVSPSIIGHYLPSTHHGKGGTEG